MGNKCGKSESDYAKMTNDEVETWHWDNWIRYLPVANIVYGVARAAVYSCKAVWNRMSSKDNNNEIAKFCYGKEIFKSIFTAAGGVLAFFSSWYLANFLGSLIGSTVGAQIMKLLGEMVAGQFVQNIMTLLGDIMTSWKEYRMKTKNEWEDLVNFEAFKIPFIGFLYSVVRPWICRYIGKEDMDEQETKVNAVINILASSFGLGAAYWFYLLSSQPGMTQIYHNIWEKCQWADEFGRLFLAPSGWLKDVIRGILPACGKGLGAGVKCGLKKLADNSKYT